MTIPTLTPLPPAPSRLETEETFVPKADALLAALPTMVTEENAAFTWMDAQLTATESARDTTITAKDAALAAQTASEAAQTGAELAESNTEQLLLSRGDLRNTGEYQVGFNYLVSDIFFYTDTGITTWYLVNTAFTSTNIVTDLSSSNVQVWQGLTKINGVTKIASVFDPKFANLVEGQAVELIGYHHDTTVGGGSGVVKLARHNGGTAISLARERPTNWNDQAQLAAWFADSGSDELCFIRALIDGIVELKGFGAIADYEYGNAAATIPGTGTDNKYPIWAFIKSLGTAHNANTAYVYGSSVVGDLGYGKYGVALTGSERFLIDTDNCRFTGKGNFNTSIVKMGDSGAAEMMRLKGSYGSMISDFTLDCGLPFTPDGTETYGADVGLVLDQVVGLEIPKINIINWRIRGMQCIHVWESKFGTIRIFNGGFFGTGAVPSAGIAFDDRGKEDFTFSGSESNQLKIDKVEFGCVGTLVKATSPCFNVDLGLVVAEGRTWSVNYPALSEAKWIIDGISQGFVVHQAWHYAHDQPYDNQAICFALTNAGQNCKFLNYRIYQEIPSGNGNFLEMPNIINNSSAYPVEVDLSIEDTGDAVTSLWAGTSAGSLVTGKINYRNDKARTIDDFMGADGVLRFAGIVTFIAGAFTGTTPSVYNWNGAAHNFSQIDGGGTFEEHKCRAIANFNGTPTGGARMEKGVVITRTGVGQYSGSFTVTMPDENYALSLSFAKSVFSDSIDIGSQTNTSFTFSVRDDAGTYHDSPILGISVFR